jgi:serine protease inhibitor
MRLFKNFLRKKDRSSLVAVMQGNNAFALGLYQKLRATTGNLFFSPYSISTALGMTYAGARGNTQTQMAQALHFALDQKQIHPAFAQLGVDLEDATRLGQVQLKIANALWPRKGYKFLKPFLSLVKKYYGVKITPADFSDEAASRRLINEWVEEKTEEKIKDLIAEGALDSATRMVLVNAIYFKGAWKEEFDPLRTAEAPFLTAPDLHMQVPMMNCKHNYRYAETDTLQIIELPYAGGRLSMLVLLPVEVDGLAKLEDILKLENLETWIKDLNETEVDVSLPKFEMSFPFRLDDTLISMGMADAFTEQADFSGMDGSRELYIGAALHKAFVAVNEQGTEAAAASAVVMVTKGMSISSIVFRADHPFLFLIRDNLTGSLLFIGRLVKPV